MFVSNLEGGDQHGYFGIYFPVMNDTAGIGLATYSNTAGIGCLPSFRAYCTFPDMTCYTEVRRYTS